MRQAGVVRGDGLRGDSGGRIQQLTGAGGVVAFGVAIGVQEEPQRDHDTLNDERASSGRT